MSEVKKSLNLMLHCGGHEATRDEVVGAETPSATDTWHPIPHISLIDKVVDQMQQAGLIVSQTVHGLWKGGLRYFGMMELTSQEDDEYSLVVGLRNSHDKSFPASLALGSGVFVCDNLAFSGEVKLARRHTRFINRDLPAVIQKAMGRLHDLRHTQERRIEAYRNHPLDDKDACEFIIRALENGVIGSQRVKPVVNEWRNPRHDDFSERNAWSLFNAFTEIMKPKERQGDRDNNNLIALPKATGQLHGMMDLQCRLDQVRVDDIEG